jgi:alpha-tubulin suppressor-like RCC1 family protein
MKQTIHIYYVSISMAFVFIVACNSVNETVDLRIISTATSVSAGEYHTCAVLSGGSVSCWGYGSYGKLGNDSTSNQSTPVEVLGF